MANFVCKGAKLKCSFGSSQSDLIVIPKEQMIFVTGENMASIDDYKPMVNIMPFGMCKSLLNPTVAAATVANFGKLQEMPCIPNTTAPWVPGKPDTYVTGMLTLLDNCKLMCMWAGIIEVTNHGQDGESVQE
jgi:hypothetical protein